ncbi:hypothetical protein ILUMI_07173 [Ignelater luminosus]|uniref:Uncharacterized protein n=1 Tax=Ignelater luminosus TaxID=2038154 RepID=A0A8K0D7X5_IGNLU|nr:hypothetical protein ILUMI_07173 [Ignelater luminosus]
MFVCFPEAKLSLEQNDAPHFATTRMNVYSHANGANIAHAQFISFISDNLGDGWNEILTPKTHQSQQDHPRYKNITEFVKKVYFAYFDVKLRDEDKPWAPHKVCSIYVEELRQWSQGEKQSFRYGVPIVWREPTNHSDYCYFCLCIVQGFNLKNRKDILYPNIRSAIRPAPHGPEVPVNWMMEVMIMILEVIN